MSTYKAWREFERACRRDFEALGFKAKRIWSEQFEEGGKADVVAEIRKRYANFIGKGEEWEKITPKINQ